MDKGGPGLDQAGTLAVGQVDGVAVDGTFAEEALGFVGVEVVAGLGEQVLHPGNLVGLFGEVGLHQAVGVFAPEGAEGLKLFGGGCRRETRGDDVGKAVPTVPLFQKRLAVVVGGSGRIAEAFGGIAVHAGLAGEKTHPAGLGGGEDGVHAGGMDRRVGGDGGGAAGENEVEVAVRDLGRVGGITEAHFLGEGVAVQPVDQPLAPGGDDGGLGVVDMGVDEAGGDEFCAVVVDARLRVAGAKIASLSNGGDVGAVDGDGALGEDAGGGKPCGERIARVA